MHRDLPLLPVSATDDRVGLAGVACASAMLAGLLWWGEAAPLTAVVLMILSYAVPVAALEIFVRRVHRNPSTGLDWSRPPTPCPRRIALKLIGIAASVAAVLVAHLLFRFYGYADLAIPLALLLTVAGALVPLTFAYVWVVDGRQVAPEDDYWRLGAILTGLLPVGAGAALREHALGWMIKGFFLPIMLAYLFYCLQRLDASDAVMSSDPIAFVAGLALVAGTLEVTIVCTGYAMTLRLFDAHIRSANPFLGAWVVTLVCYEPFNQIITGQVFRYRMEADWTSVIGGYPWLALPWIAVLLASFAVWVWATSVYGLRWSNLTHRGIITGGPYRFTKHPDYAAKIVFFWLTTVPFLTAATPLAALSGTAGLIAVSVIYFGRARMEERHLSQDPVYVAYALAMNDRSIFAPLARRFPVLAYRAPGATVVDPARDGGGAAPVPAE